MDKRRQDVCSADYKVVGLITEHRYNEVMIKWIIVSGASYHVWQTYLCRHIYMISNLKRAQNFTLGDRYSIFSVQTSMGQSKIEFSDIICTKVIG